MASLIVRRKQRVDLIGQEQNRLKQCRDPEIRKLIGMSLESLRRSGVMEQMEHLRQASKNPRGLGTGPQGNWYQFRC